METITNVIDIISKAKDSGISISLHEGGLRLKIAKNRSVDPEVLATLKMHKEDIKDFLNSEAGNISGINAPENSIATINRETYGKIPLSFAQERLWFVDQLQGSVQYNIPFVFKLTGPLDKEALEFSFREIVNRHEVLRTKLREDQGRAYQEISKVNNLTVQHFNGGGLSEAELESQIEYWTNQPFDLSNEHPIRIALIELSSQEFILVLVIHHIATDGWSSTVLIGEFATLYQSYVEGNVAHLPNLTVQYADYAAWQRKEHSDQSLDRQLTYWKNQLRDVTPLEVPTDYPRPAIQSTAGDQRRVLIPASLAKQLTRLAESEGVTLFMVLLSCFKILLHRYSGQADICIGTPVAGRTLKELEPLIGSFVNTLAIRSSIDDQKTFKDYLQEVKKTTLEAYANQQVPFEQVVEAVGVKRDLSRNPIFQVTLTLQNTPEEESYEFGDIQIENYYSGAIFAQRDLSFLVTEYPEGLDIMVNFCKDLYEAKTIERMLAQVQVLLEGVVRNPLQTISQLPLLTTEEKKQLLFEFNNTQYPYPDQESIATLFEKQVSQTPDNVALVIEEREYTYREINELANQTAHYLKQNFNTQPDDLVGVMLDRSEWAIIAAIGILKAGAGYVPIDLNYPDDRKRFIIDDTKLKGLIIHSDHLFDVLEYNINLFSIDIQLTECEENWKTNPDHQEVSGQNLAYVIYTSGSLGKPKGVLINQYSIARLIFNPNFDFLNEDTVLYQYAPLAFDASTFEVWGALLRGGKLIVSAPGVKSMEALATDIAGKGVNTMWLTAGLFHVAVDTHIELFSGLKYILAGGESVRTDCIQAVLTQYPDLTFINGYGPTESTTFAIVNQLDAPEKVRLAFNDIGTPIGNTQIYILNDRADTMLPLGGVGEICIAGDGLARGYLNKEELTDEKFVAHPFIPQQKIYKTGDLGRWLPNGHIEYLGRIDNQVKIRGFRIEPGEIETVIHQSDLVKQAAVVAKDDPTGGKRLVAYLTTIDTLDREALTNYLKDVLPEYMIPTIWVELPELPLTANGKVDRKALPEPDFTKMVAENYVAPRTEIESQLAEIWQDLLDVEKIGIKDDFFDLGGHSLLATRVVSSIRTAFSINLNIRDLFQYKTIEELAEVLQNRGNTGEAMPTIKALERPEKIPLSFAQQRLWFIDKFQGTTHYHMPSVLRFREAPNQQALEQAFQMLINRHEILRTVYVMEEGLPYQKVLEKDGWSIDYFNAEQLSSREELDTYIEGYIGQPFDLETDHMFRAQLICCGPEEHLLVMVTHHIASDGWSHPIFNRELETFYAAITEGQEVELPALEVQYADYAIWQQTHLAGQVLEQKLQFWQDQLMDVEPLLLPTDFARPAIQSTQGNLITSTVDKALVNTLKTLCQQEDITLFMLLIGAYKVLLHKYSGQTDICVGTPIANREHKEIEPLIGFFVNALAIRSDLSQKPTFRDFLHQVKETSLEAFAHQDVPFEKIVDRVESQRDQSRSPIFQVMFGLQNHSEALTTSLEEVDLSFEQVNHQTSQFDLNLMVKETDAGLNLTVEYCSDLFEKTTIHRLLDHYKNLLQAISLAPERSIEQLEILGEEETEQLLAAFNDTCVEFPTTTGLLAHFDNQVNLTPTALAISFEQKALSYEELDAKANQLAKYLIKDHQVQPNDLVGIMQENTAWAVISILGVLKAGATYVPIDPKYPQERKAYIIKDTAIKILLTETAFAREECAKALNSIEVENLDSMLAEAALETTLLPPYRNQSSLAYIIYTSGSTGKPKGVMISDANLLNYLHFGLDHYGKALEQFSFPLLTSLSFDLTQTSIFLTLFSGGQLFINRNTDIDLVLQDVAANNRINAVKLTPSHVNLLEGLHSEGIKIAIVGGEKLDTHHVSKLRALAPGITIYNEYGPTEATIGCTVFDIESEESRILIGKPIANTDILILDNQQQLVPIGVKGEICIAGKGVAQGYLNRPELTAERFIANPYDLENHSVMYRTGDIARWLPDGNLEYLGRVDDQVKIRGYRIELGEIESVLQSCEAVYQCVVMAKKDAYNVDQLVGYIVPSGVFNKQAIREYLSQQLPEYMIPTLLIELAEIPLTANGKADKKALPGIGQLSMSSKEYVAPTTETEQSLSMIWAEVLKVEKAGISDNFFEIGGHSLLAVIVTNKIAKAFQVQVSLRDFFNHPTIEQLGGYIDQCQREEYQPLPPMPEQDYYPLSPAQNRIFTLQHFDPTSTAYNIPFYVELEKNYTVEQIQEAFTTLVDRHQSLRTYFGFQQGQPVQSIHDQMVVKVEAMNGKAPEDVLQSFIQPFDLYQAPLFRIGLLSSKQKQYLLMDLHHIITDGVSQQVLAEELAALLDGQSLSPVPVKYVDYINWWNQPEQRKVLEIQEKFWLSTFESNPPLLEFPTDFPRPEFRSFKGASALFRLSEEETQIIKRIAQEAKTTNYTVLLSIWSLLLAKISNQDDITVGTPVSGRRHPDIERVVGMFVNTLPIRSQVQHQTSFKSYLEQVKTRFFNAFEHQDYPFEKLVENVWDGRIKGRNPLFDTLFALQNIDEGQEMPVEVGNDVSFSEEGTLSKFDMSLTAFDGGEELCFSLVYNTQLFLPTTIARFIGYFRTIIDQIRISEDLCIQDFDLLSGQEKQLLQDQFGNNHFVPATDAKTLVDLLKEATEKNPEATAIHHNGRNWTYQELDAFSNQIAGHLIKEGIPQQTLCGICMDRSFAMIASIIGALKAGTAYVPISPDYPLERIQYILEDTQCAFVLTHSAFKDLFGERSTAKSILVDQLDKSDTRVYPSVYIQPTDLAYVIYTSGSTGMPKGVKVQHQSIVNDVLYYARTMELGQQDKPVLLANYVFDASVEQIFAPLASGACLTLIDMEQMLDAQQLEHLIQEEGITHLHATPTLLSTITPKQYQELKIVCAGGEKCPVELTQQWSPFVKFFNKYGPTETTVTATYFEYDANGTFKQQVPIGRPSGNTQLYVLNAQQQLLPLGTTGELYIGGAGLATGYLNQPQLSNEKFIQSPFDERQLLYRTGDFVRWLPDGNLLFKGRVDDQIKIRGQRIELGEIEQVMNTCSLIKKAVVSVRNNDAGTPQIIGYLIADGQIDPNGIQTFLKNHLPKHMIPAALVALEAFPCTPSGKVDKKLLPKPDSKNSLRNAFTAPQNEQEEKMAAIWSEILGLDQVSIHDNFFEIGGHSLLAIRLINGINQQFGQQISLRDLYVHATIAKLLEALETNEIAPQSLLLPLTSIREEQPSIFMIPPILGTSIVFHPLASILEEQGINCLGFQYKGFDRDEPFHKSIEDMASSFCESIQEMITDTEKNLTIMGYSMGAIVAHALVKELENKGYHCKLILLDRGISNSLDSGSEQHQQLLVQHLKGAALSFTPEMEARALALVKHNLAIQQNYTLQPSAIRANVLALEAQQANRKVSMKAWKRFTSGSLQHQYLDTDHFGMLDKQVLPKLVEQVLKFNS